MGLDYWQHNFNEIKHRAFHLLKTEIWSDCSFLVGTAPNQQIIAGHKLVLAMASPVFEKMFFGQLADKDNPILIPDVQPEAFQAMLEYIYSDSINISSFDNACQLFNVAKKYMLPELEKKCTEYVREGVSPKNACRTYEFAKFFEEQELMKSSMEVITCNIREVLEDPNFTDIEDSTLMAILDQNELNIDSELDLFNAVVRFANERGIIANDSMQNVEKVKMEPDENHDNLIPSNESPTSDVDSKASVSEHPPPAAAANDQPSTSNAAASPVDATKLNYFMDDKHLNKNKAMIRQAIKKIRFLSLTAEEMAMGPARSKLLEQHEALAVLIKISSPSPDDYPMPEGFCHSRSRRELSFQKHNPFSKTQAIANRSARLNKIKSGGIFGRDIFGRDIAYN